MLDWLGSPPINRDPGRFSVKDSLSAAEALIFTKSGDVFLLKVLPMVWDALPRKQGFRQSFKGFSSAAGFAAGGQIGPWREVQSFGLALGAPPVLVQKS